MVDLGEQYLVQITSGTIVLRDDKVFTVSTTSRERGGSVTKTETSEAVGTWAKTGNEIMFLIDDVGFIASFDGSTLEMMDGQYALMYRK